MQVNLDKSPMPKNSARAINIYYYTVKKNPGTFLKDIANFMEKYRNVPLKDSKHFLIAN